MCFIFIEAVDLESTLTCIFDLRHLWRPKPSYYPNFQANINHTHSAQALNFIEIGWLVFEKKENEYNDIYF